jgi:general secretion pathway protein M
MSERWKAWFDARSLRERRMILVMLALLALTILWAGLILPVTDGLAAARTRAASAVQLLAGTEARIDAVRALEHDKPAPLAAPLDTVIRERADAAGFTLGGVTAQGADRVQISIASARPGPLMAWIGGLEDGGILVDTLSLTDNGDKTVGAQVLLKARGQ